jgi:hypothetical protein
VTIAELEVQLLSLNASIERCRFYGRSWLIELRTTRSDGSYMPILINAYSLQDAISRAITAIDHVREVTP